MNTLHELEVARYDWERARKIRDHLLILWLERPTPGKRELHFKAVREAAAALARFKTLGG